MILVLMGVSGSGKTTLGKKLAEKWGWLFLEGDDFHPPGNKAKMESGLPLTDADRVPWLRALAAELKKMSVENKDTVVACSALKEKFRTFLSSGLQVRWVYLKGDRETIRGRLEGRRDHFMGPDLLESQLEILEEPREAIVVDIGLDLDKLIRIISDQLKGT